MLRPIEARDNAAVARIIRTVMPEFGADGPGFAIHDAEVDAMYQAYSQPRTGYYVLDADGEIIGGAGFAQLVGGDEDVCELRKMYVLPVGRGRGLGQRLLDTVLSAAKGAGFKLCYLETLGHMAAARKLYERNGFEQICAPMGNTGHGSCDTWYAKTLA